MAPVLAPSPFEDKLGCWGGKRGPWTHGRAGSPAPASPGQRLITPALGQAPPREEGAGTPSGRRAYALLNLWPFLPIAEHQTFSVPHARSAS